MPDGGERWELRRGEEGWPPSLESLEQPPDVIYGMGDRATLTNSCLSVIGARRATPYGLAAARLAGRVAAESGITLVSGGALGCDAASARAALDAGGTTIVVSGTGADKVYPRSSEDVFARARTHGAVISLEPWGAPPKRYTFPRRNPIIAALSQSTVICEAGRHSGTFSTAMAAAQMGRDLYVIPGSIFSPESMGANQLIADGAYIIPSEMDLEQRISLDYGVLRMVREGVPRTEGRIVSALISEPTRADDLARFLGESVVGILGALADYESKGMVRRLPDGRFSLTESAYLAHDRMVRRHGDELAQDGGGGASCQTIGG